MITFQICIYSVLWWGKWGGGEGNAISTVQNLIQWERHIIRKTFIPRLLYYALWLLCFLYNEIDCADTKHYGFCLKQTNKPFIFVTDRKTSKFWKRYFPRMLKLTGKRREIWFYHMQSCHSGVLKILFCCCCCFKKHNSSKGPFLSPKFY